MSNANQHNTTDSNASINTDEQPPPQPPTDSSSVTNSQPLSRDVAQGGGGKSKIKTLAPFLRYFHEIRVVAETKDGKMMSGILNSSDNEMNIVLREVFRVDDLESILHHPKNPRARNVASAGRNNPYNQSVRQRQDSGTSETIFAAGMGNNKVEYDFDLLHIRGSNLLYVHFPRSTNLRALVSKGLEREKSAMNKYKRGIRK